MNWVCKEECYVTIDGNWRLCAPGDCVTGNIKESSQKFFNKTSISQDVDEAPDPTNRELKVSIKELGGSFPPNANKAKLKEILAELKGD